MCYSCTDPFGLMDAVDTVRAAMDREASPFFAALRLIVIDSIGLCSLLLTPGLRGQPQPGYSVVASFLRQLRSIAFTFNIAILMTNHAVSRFGDDPTGTMLQPALGVWWSHAPHLRICLFPTTRGGAVLEEDDDADQDRRVSAAGLAHVTGLLAKSTRSSVDVPAVQLVLTAAGVRAAPT
eukprot:TRINITY_DN6300_c0_g1_i1.p1 TRINITY_DN6300_c0_g1~~TRINITY_DN6300_c0_g1_i1.p1  ORF type:complete len:180 (-),score=32.68 TRINITY_DN6300_c0_g1_i1:20-559(-)